MKKNVIIMGAAGRDFHNFNTFLRDNENYHVVAFTATQIPDIDGRKYPAELTETINRTECDLVIGATPIDLSRLIQTNKRILRVSYDLEEIGSPNLQEVLKDF